MVVCKPILVFSLSLSKAEQFDLIIISVFFFLGGGGGAPRPPPLWEIGLREPISLIYYKFY